MTTLVGWFLEWMSAQIHLLERLSGTCLNFVLNQTLEIVCRRYVLMRIVRDFGCSYIRYQKIEHFFTLKIITFVCISASLHTRMKDTRTSNVVNFHLILNIYSYCGVILIFLLLQNWEEFLYSADEYVFCDII